MGDLAVDRAVEPIGDGRYRAMVSQDWEIWGPMGGYVASIALRAAVFGGEARRSPATPSARWQLAHVPSGGVKSGGSSGL